ncbi:MAG: DUF3368 domain-containing protein [Chloroflexi bacterium]|nr:DUF3368 domain-containing protein [Chloroflexota bacterium]
MSNSIVVSDAGPLMALAKLNALDLLAKLYPVVYASPIVYDETVTQGFAQNASDAPLLENYFDHGFLVVKPIASPPTLQEPIKIQDGERESIQLAIQLDATEFLIDDSRARRVAEINFATAGLSIVARGTLGIIYLSFQRGYLNREQTIQLLESIKTRRDIWIHAKLCDKVLRLIRI